ncbi:MAG: sigma-70 family RNA polymerase sigma factor [Planctomycetes bacterium]|nr:sigma-70 family RNA polymerase sigma factor [Planctomycetota bacterium]
MNVDPAPTTHPRLRPSPPAAASAPPVDFRTVYTTLYQPVANYLLRRTGDAHATEDLLADVFLSVFRALPAYRDRGLPIRHWVFKIANRMATRWLRRRHAEHRLLAMRADVADLVARPADTGLEARETARALLATMPIALQEVAALHWLGECPLAEVAAVVGVPVGTVKSRLARARELLRERMEHRQ